MSLQCSRSCAINRPPALFLSMDEKRKIMVTVGSHFFIFLNKINPQYSICLKTYLPSFYMVCHSSFKLRQIFQKRYSPLLPLYRIRSIQRTWFRAFLAITVQFLFTKGKTPSYDEVVHLIFLQAGLREGAAKSEKNEGHYSVS